MLETGPLRPVGKHARAEASPDAQADSIVSEGVLHMQEVLIRTLLRRDPAANHTFQLRWPSAAAAAAAAAVGAETAAATTAPDGSDDLAALPADLLLLMRIHALDDGFLAQLGAGGRDAVVSRVKQGGILFPSHELEAAGMLRARVDALLRGYGTALAEDEAAMASLSSSPEPGGAEADIIRWCVRVRAGEKRLLHFHSAILASYQHKLRGGIDAEKRGAARQRRKSNEERPRQEEEDEEESLHLEL